MPASTANSRIYCFGGSAENGYATAVLANDLNALRQGRYSFIMSDSHPLLLAGLPAHKWVRFANCQLIVVAISTFLIADARAGALWDRRRSGR
jgi:hypothetical protein